MCRTCQFIEHTFAGSITKSAESAEERRKINGGEGGGGGGWGRGEPVSDCKSVAISIKPTFLYSHPAVHANERPTIDPRSGEEKLSIFRL